MPSPGEFDLDMMERDLRHALRVNKSTVSRKTAHLVAVSGPDMLDLIAELRDARDRIARCEEEHG